MILRTHYDLKKTPEDFIMGKIALLLLALFVQPKSKNNSPWVDQSPRFLKGIWIHDIVALNIDTVVAVGDSGTIIRTTDGGNNWQIQSSKSDLKHDLYSVHFVNENVGWTVGESGTILKTVNGGTTWFSLRSGTSKKLYDVHFVNEDTGWAVGGHYIPDHINEGGIILKTTNGGNDWFAQSAGLPDRLLDIVYLFLRYLLDGPRTFRAVYFTDSNNGWIVGAYGTILRTTNGGESWIAHGTFHNLDAVHFIDAQNGWAVGMSETILKTTDGGIRWMAQMDGSSHSRTAHHFNYVYFVNDSTGWAGGYYSPILKTTNGGQSWRPLSPQQTTHLSAIHFLDEQLGWAVGDDGELFGNGKILKTTSGGETFYNRVIEK
jgi:photosystem II stability/assembly factor-like uncharacterized protein